MTFRRPAVSLLAGLALSCGGSGSSPTSSDSSGGTGSTTCTTAGQCTFVRDVLQSYYYWYKDLPNPDPGSFSSPEAYLEAVRYRTLDSSFSYITSKASSDAFYSDSQFIGFGLSYKQTGDAELRLVQTFPGSPAADAGMDRGDTLLSVNGRAVADLLRTGDIGTVFGAEQVGVTADIAWRDPQGRQRTATLAKRLVTIPTVSQTAVLDAGRSRVAYIHFRNFVQPSVEALNAAFTEVRDAGATELVLDLRYNGGGLVSVAQHLAGLIGGPPLVGQVFVQFTHNDKQSSRDTSYKLEAKPQALGVTRLVVIATRGSASASEAIVNGLRPYMDVKVVGDSTYGKPVGQYGFDFCEKVLYPVAFLVTNSLGQADYFGGIPADCAAADDVDHP
ncbi:MAG TPA: S41 family peptidase, partial [Vicinamibacteria bacterium]|nr:S41 family peptidase [Vicinamibacteria bacterium]